MDSVAFTRLAFYVCVAIAAIFVIETLFLTFVVPLQRKRGINRRLHVLKDGNVGERALVSLKTERGIFDNSLGAQGWLRSLLVQSGLRLTATRFTMIVVFSCLAIFVLMRIVLVFSPLVAVLAAFVGGALLPLHVVRTSRKRRQRKFSEQFPEALDIVVRSLRSGHPVPVALALVGREMPDPVGSEFGMTIDEMTYGLELPRALRNLADRVGIPDLSLLVTAVTLQTTSGGNLAEVLSNLSKVMRDRFQLRRKVKALSAEGRFSGWALSILPAVIAGLVYVQVPTYYSDVWSEPIFKPVIAGLCVWALIGDFIMFKLVNFKY